MSLLPSKLGSFFQTSSLNLIEVGLNGGGAVVVAVLVLSLVESAEPNFFFLDSQLAMQSSVSWRRFWCLRTCQHGTKTVKISMTKTDRAILGLLAH